MIAHLPMITIDLVKAIVEEVNIHNEDPNLFKDYFNADNGDNDDYYNVFTILKTGEKVSLKAFADVEPSINEYDEEDLDTLAGNNLYINGRNYGYIKQVLDNNTLVAVKNEIDVVESEKQGKRTLKEVETVYYLEHSVKRHASFVSYAF
jgi:hypothetical protein